MAADPPHGGSNKAANARTETELPTRVICVRRSSALFAVIPRNPRISREHLS